MRMAIPSLASAQWLGATSRGVDPVGVNEHGPASEESEPAAPTPADAAANKPVASPQVNNEPVATEPSEETNAGDKTIPVPEPAPEEPKAPSPAQVAAAVGETSPKTPAGEASETARPGHAPTPA